MENRNKSRRNSHLIEKKSNDSLIIISTVVLIVGALAFGVYEFSSSDMYKKLNVSTVPTSRFTSVDTTNIKSVNGRIVDKITRDRNYGELGYVIIYENENKDVFEITDALPYWGRVEKGDMANITFKEKIVRVFGEERLEVEFKDVVKIK